MSRPAGRYIPGLVVLLAIGVGARGVASIVPGVTPLILAVVAGMVIANTVSVPERVRPGIGLNGVLLETGIVLLGASVSLQALTDAGPRLLLLTVGVVATGLLVVTAASRIVGLEDDIGALLAAGGSICGVSAVAAVAGVLDADETDIGYAAGAVILFDAVTLLVFPPLGYALGLDQQTFGVWAGVTMLSTGPVAAAGLSYGAVAGQWAALTKLVRNTLIGPVVVVYSVVYATESTPKLGRLWTTFPKFLIGFLAVAVVANTGVLSDASLDRLALVNDWLFLLAFAGLGFDIRLRRIRSAGLAPVGVLAGYLLATGLAVLGVLHVVGL